MGNDNADIINMALALFCSDASCSASQPTPEELDAWSPEDDDEFDGWCESLQRKRDDARYREARDRVWADANYHKATWGSFGAEHAPDGTKNPLSIMQTPPRGGPTAHRKRDKVAR